MPDDVRDLAVAIARGSAAEVVLHGRFRWSESDGSPENIQRSIAQVIAEASSSMVAQANISKAGVLSILQQGN